MIRYLSISISIILLFFILEWRYPIFFLEDDNYSQFFPVLSSSLDFFYQTFEIPYYSFQHNNGVEILGLTQYGFFDPVLHVSYAICQVLNKPYHLFDFYCLIYFILTAMVFIKTLRQYEDWALLLPLIFLFSGFMLITARSWYYLMPYVLSITCIFYRVVNTILHKVAYTTIYKDTIFLSLFIYFGNPQLQFYNLMVFYFFLLWIYRSSFFKDFALFGKLIKSVFILLLISLPIFYLFYLVEYKSDRINLSSGIMNIDGFIQLFIPFLKNEKLWLQKPDTINTNWIYFNLNIIAIIGFVHAIRVGILQLKNIFRQRKIQFVDNDFFHLVVIISFIMMTKVYYLVMYLPVFSKFQIALKFYYIFNIAALYVGVIQIMKCKPGIKRGIIFLSVIQIILVVTIVNQSFFDFHYRKDDPYQKKEVLHLKKYLSPAPKIYSVGQFRSQDPGYAQALFHNLSLIHHVPSINGYEPVVKMGEWDNVFKLKEAGVTELIRYNVSDPGVYYFDKRELLDNAALMDQLKNYSAAIDTLGNLIIYRTGYSSPFSSVYYGINHAVFELKSPANLRDIILPTKFNRHIICQVGERKVRLRASVNQLSTIADSVYGQRIELSYRPF